VLARKRLNAEGNFAYVGSEQVVDESTSGKLRLSRRSETIYAFHAIDESPAFRLISSSKIPPGPIEVQGVRLITEIGGGLSTMVTWQNISIKADKILTFDVQDAKAIIDELNIKRTNITGSEAKRSMTALRVPGF
jgi:hypothetical protein